MSGGGKRGSGAAAAEAAAIPPGSRKIVQSLKEIVNCSEAEIYAMLKECNMDPSEAVHRLLTQDTFHEVKSKREKKKETKDAPESRSRSVNNNPSRGAKGGADRGVRSSFKQSMLNDYGANHAKTVHKETDSYSISSVAGSLTAGSSLNPWSTPVSSTVSVQETTQTTSNNSLPLPSQPSSAFQHTWSRTPGQLSMADIVRMGKPQVKPSGGHVASDMFQASHNQIMSNTSLTALQAPEVTSESAQEFHASHDPVLHNDESCEVGTNIGHYNSHDDWSLVGETSQGSGSIHYEVTGAPSYTELSASSNLPADQSNLDQDPHLDENQVEEEYANGDFVPTESIRSESISEGQIEGDNSGYSTHSEHGPLNDMPDNSQMHAFQHHEVGDINEEISSATANLQQLNLQKRNLGTPFADGNPAVIIPSHLQVTNADCSRLSFGSFGSNINTAPGLFSQKTPEPNLEVAAAPEDRPLDHLGTRNPEYYDAEPLESTLNENVTAISSMTSQSYDMPSASESQSVRDEALDASHGQQGSFPSVSGYEFSAAAQPTSTYGYPDPNSQVPNISSFSNVMQPYTNTLPSTFPSSLLPQSMQPPREFDLPFSTLLMTQSMPTKYNTPSPSISGTLSTSEVKPEVFSAAQATPQSLPSSNMHNSGGQALPQHLPIHPYSQPTLPLGHFANMIGYPFLPQSYAFLPSAAFQHAYASSSPFHQSPAAAAMKYSQLAQYKSSAAGGSLPQAAALPPGYGGGFTSSTNSIPGNFSLNQSAASASTTMGFEEALSSHYKEGSQYLQTQQQNENSAMWAHGAGSRSVSALPGNAFYNFPGQQSQQNGGFRQAAQLQPSQYGQLGYLNLYQSQGGPAQEQQHQQNPSEGSLSSGSQPQAAASHQLWQHGY